MTQQVNQGRVEIEDGRPHVYVVLVIFWGQAAEVILAARGRHACQSGHVNVNNVNNSRNKCYLNIERNGSGVELRTLDYENPGSNSVLWC